MIRTCAITVDSNLLQKQSKLTASTVKIAWYRMPPCVNYSAALPTCSGQCIPLPEMCVEGSLTWPHTSKQLASCSLSLPPAVDFVLQSMHTTPQYSLLRGLTITMSFIDFYIETEFWIRGVLYIRGHSLHKILQYVLTWEILLTVYSSLCAWRADFSLTVLSFCE